MFSAPLLQMVFLLSLAMISHGSRTIMLQKTMAKPWQIDCFFLFFFPLAMISKYDLVSATNPR